MLAKFLLYYRHLQITDNWSIMYISFIRKKESKNFFQGLNTTTYWVPLQHRNIFFYTRRVSFSILSSFLFERASLSLLWAVVGHHMHHHQNNSFAFCGILENKAQHTFWHHKWHSCKWFLHSVHALYMWTWCHCWWDDGKWSRLNLMSGITTGAWTKLVSFLKLFPSTNWLITFFLNSKLVVLAWFWDLVWRMCAFDTQTSTM